ncbi:MAG: hypothetical protein ABIU29_12310 [Chthoniobacterales bacterium]
MITTAAFGVLPSANFSVALGFHYYSLVENSDELRHADIEENLTGNSRDIGYAVAR